MMRLDLAGLADASREALMSEWREVVGPLPKTLKQAPDDTDFEPLIRWIMCADIPSVWIVGLRVLHGAMLFGLPLNLGAALCASIMGSPMWLMSVMMGALCGTIRALSPSLIQHARLLAIMSQAFSSLG